MALGLPMSKGGSGTFLPRLQYDARAGRFFRVDREQDAEGKWRALPPEEMTMPVMMAVDLENIEVGWIKLDPSGVDFRMVAIGEPLPPRPDGMTSDGKPLYNSGFRLRVWSKSLGLREWSSTARCVIEAIDPLHDQFSAEMAQHRGEVPIVTIARTIPIVITTKKGRQTNYQPVMQIEKWIARPEAMLADQPAKPEAKDEVPFEPAPQRTAPAGAQHVPPPAQPAPAAAVVGTDTDF